MNGHSFGTTLSRLAREPVFRVLTKFALRQFPVSVRTRALWDISPRPQYLNGLVAAAEQARREGRPAFSAIEFGVAGGRGLLVLQQESAAVEKEFGIAIQVYGFDMGGHGLPAFLGDYRDHPDLWRPGDYPMDEAALRARLSTRTTLVLGNARDTAGRFFTEFSPPPVGFVAFDMDLYSSTRDALSIFTHPDKIMLWHVPLYFDDITLMANHRFAGELLAIDEFNAQNEGVKIDVWHGIRGNRPFPEQPYLEQMYVAHDLEAISRASLDRDLVHLAL